MSTANTTIEITPIKLSPWWGLLALFSIGFPLFFIFVERPTPPPIIEPAPSFSLTDHTNSPVQTTDFSGDVTLVNFIFTRCKDVCPALTTKFKHIKDQLNQHSDIHYISISVDPEYDTPAVLQEYRARFNIDSPDWYFLTGPYEQIRQLISDYQLAYQQGPSSDDDVPNIIHSEKIILIDRDNQIRGFYSTNEAGVYELLRAVSTI